MITDNGKEIIAKYLLGQVPAYATHIAIGCGAETLNLTDAIPDNMREKAVLDFEMIRQPITSKGFVDEKYGPWTPSSISLTSNIITLKIPIADYTGDLNVTDKILINVNDAGLTTGNKLIYNGVHVIKDITTDATHVSFTFDYTASNIGSVTLNDGLNQFYGIKTKIALVAEMPTANRYEITEVGIWSAGTNVLASNSDSRHIFNFADTWEMHTPSGAVTKIPLVPRIGADSSGAVSPLGNIQYTVTTANENIFYANTNDPSFHTAARRERKEGPRFLNTTLMMRGDTSVLSAGAVVEASSTHVHLNGVNLATQYNSPSDTLTLAYSLIAREGLTATVPTGNVKIFVEFYQNEYNLTSGYAKWIIDKPASSFTANFYQTDTVTISALTEVAPDFSPANIRVCRMFVNVDDTTPSNFYVALDGLRLDNITTQNPVYKLTGYSIVRNESAYPIVKNPNSKSYVEFRFALGIV
jgi:hypothetical protein